MTKRKYIKVFTVGQFLELVDPCNKVIIHDAFEWETYEFQDVHTMVDDEAGKELLSCWVYDIDINTLGVVQLTINDGFTDEKGNAYIVDSDINDNTYVEYEED